MVGETVSHYRITRQLGSGGMGVVYEAVDTKPDRTVALKFLPPESTRAPEVKARFIHEAKAAALLTGLGFGLGSYVSHLNTPVTTGLEEPAVVEMEQSAAEGLLAEMRLTPEGFRLIAKGRSALKGG